MSQSEYITDDIMNYSESKTGSLLSFQSNSINLDNDKDLECEIILDIVGELKISFGLEEAKILLKQLKKSIKVSNFNMGN